MIDGVLVTLLVLGLWRALRSRPEGLGAVAPRPFYEGGTYWRHGRACTERRDPEHTARVLRARATAREWTWD